MKLCMMYRYFAFIILVSLCSNLYAYESSDKLKTVLIGKIAKYVTWEESSSKEFRITILNSPFEDLMDKRYEGRKINDKPVVMQYIDDATNVPPTDILYITDVKITELKNILEKVSGENVLTISDSRGFAEKDGIIQFYLVSQKIKLKINNGVSKKEGVIISSTLLRIAEILE